ncbi:serine/threonine protein kinase [Hazenella sp. IB182357]|uniref:Serine/threonine protein kinase n=1 Tax=Polycladospora coralii TaxID=2771432 RepID=A0A926N9E6_9BACL|nr:serine/threonine protein kinase [Polycladospora coralii]MBD1370910.1 serine/threonine protein kinase [Polycladospora coralii]MBS7529849.1 serine/threonine protein kinase [Polycladospora coralii]
MDLHDIEEKLKEIRFRVNPKNQLVTIHAIPTEFNLIGFGTDAVVVQPNRAKQLVYKLFANENTQIKRREAEVYRKLKLSPYFPKFHKEGDNYLVLSYEAGLTLYQCLELGVDIPITLIEDVTAAIDYAKKQGLNPRDIHLKNVILQNGRGKIIDVSEYSQKGNDYRWEHLVEGYHQYYSLIRGKKVPKWLIERVKKKYLSISTHEDVPHKLFEKISSVWSGVIIPRERKDIDAQQSK